MSHMPAPRELDPEAAGLIRASLASDQFSTDRILTRAFEEDLNGLFFAFTVANLAARILAQACGSEAQAVALMDNWINGLVRERVRAASLQLDFCAICAFCLENARWDRIFREKFADPDYYKAVPVRFSSPLR